MRLQLLHRDKKWLYSVYCSDNRSHFVLDAVFPGVGWDSIVLRLTPEEASIFVENKEKFLQFVNQVLRDRNTEGVATRRITATQISDTEIAI